MTVSLPVPPHICQRDIADPDRLEACGPTSVAMIESAYGDTTAAEAVEAALRARYGEGGVQHGTTVGELTWYVGERQLNERCTWTGTSVDAMSAQLQSGSYVLLLFQDDTDGDPSFVGPFTHFAVLFGLSAALAYVANPWHENPSDTYVLAQLQAALIDSIAIGPPEDDMTPQEAARLAAVEEAVSEHAGRLDSLDNRVLEVCYGMILGRTIEPGAFGDGTVAYWIGRMNGSREAPAAVTDAGHGGFEGFVFELMTTPEAVGYRQTGEPDLAGHPGAVAWTNATPWRAMLPPAQPVQEVTSGH